MTFEPPLTSARTAFRTSSGPSASRPMMLPFFFNDTATTEIYTLSLHDALPIFGLPHHHPDLPAHPEIDFGLRRAPVRGAVQPAPHHLGAGPRVEDVLGRCREGPLDTHHAAGLLGHFRSSRYSPTTSKRRSQRFRWLSIQSEASASACGRRARRWVLPS